MLLRLRTMCVCGTFACAGAQAGTDLSDARVDDGRECHQWEVSGTPATVSCVKTTWKIHL